MSTPTKPTTRPVLLRFMTYPLDGSKATQLGQDQWIDDNQAFGGHYAYGTQHELSVEGEPAISYLAAMMPLIKQIPHATEEGKKQILMIVHLTTPECWEEAQVVTQNRLRGEDL